jgi:hypothetical protein
MFTRAEALEFAFEQGLKGANFVYRSGGQLVFYYWQSDETCLRHGDGSRTDEPTEGRLAQVLGGRGEGWFVSAKVDGSWSWYFSPEDEVPHKD